jgi:GT2 family glycosyltransferase
MDALKFAQASMNYERLLAGYPHEIIGIHDATSLAEGYNRGMARAGGDILIFSHDDVLILDTGFAAKTSARLQDHDLLGFCGTDLLLGPGWVGAGPPHLVGAVAHVQERALLLTVYGIADWPVAGNIQALDGFCLMTTRVAARATGFDADAFDGFHLYDLDFSFAAHLAGYRLGVCCDMPLIHASTGNFRAPQFARAAQRFARKYAAHLPDIPVYDGSKGKATLFQDYHAVVNTWTEDILKRAAYRHSQQPSRKPVDTDLSHGT